jgi:hypothetical protein
MPSATFARPRIFQGQHQQGTHPACLRPDRQQFLICCEDRKGSGANATIRISDDRQVPGFVTVEDLFRGRPFDQEIVVLCVRWYLSYKLSYRDLVAMMGERGIDLAHTTILRWVQHYTPEFEKRWNRFARMLVVPGRMDETYISPG